MKKTENEVERRKIGKGIDPREGWRSEQKTK